jgi:hypothetical protein
MATIMVLWSLEVQKALQKWIMSGPYSIAHKTMDKPDISTQFLLGVTGKF